MSCMTPFYHKAQALTSNYVFAVYANKVLVQKFGQIHNRCNVNESELFALNN